MAGNYTKRWLDVVSGKKTGALASTERFALSALSGIYRLGIAARNATFDLGLRRPFKADVPVISVGNITTGGTGKTPMVAWFVQQLQQLGASPGILSRGYRSLNDADGKPLANDEKLLLDQLCPDVPHVQNRSRRLGYEQLRQHHDVNVIVLDDAFQHRQFVRDFDVVLLDATNPFGFKAVLPRGMLREPICNLNRAHEIIITRAVSTNEHEKLVKTLKKCGPQVSEIPLVTFRCQSLINSHGESILPAELTDQKVGAFCGIGNPLAFRKTLADIGCPVDENCFRSYPDHHHYSNKDAAELQQWAQHQKLTAVLTTQKDLVKINRPFLGPTPLWSVRIEAEFLSGESLVLSRLKALINKEKTPPK